MRTNVFRMRKIGFFLRSFQTKITFVFIISMLCAGALSNFVIYRYSIDAQQAQLRDKIKIIAQATAMGVNAEDIKNIPLNKDGTDSPAYKNIINKFNEMIQVNQGIRGIYLVAKNNNAPGLHFIAGIPEFCPGEYYNTDGFPKIPEGSGGPVANDKFTAWRTGKFLSAAAPVKDAKGVAVAILGIDIDVSGAYTSKETEERLTLVFLFGIALSVLLGTVLSRSITEPVEELVKAANKIGEENLQYKVNIKSEDEIGELAHSFNHMAENLYNSRKKLHNYFYNVMKSLIRILEAKDLYTRGHSERVAEYSVQIAAKMGLPLEKVELLRDAAFLHDIGKLGITENVLNKKEELNKNDWEIIRSHPLIGEEILKPILLTEEMLAIIRGHHERYDGSGYPDKLNGENIPVLTAIVGIADAWDAMTSDRAYRPALSKTIAIEELRKNAGKQFNKKITEIFIEILEDE